MTSASAPVLTSPLSTELSTTTRTPRFRPTRRSYRSVARTQSYGRARSLARGLSGACLNGYGLAAQSGAAVRQRRLAVAPSQVLNRTHKSAPTASAHHSACAPAAPPPYVPPAPELRGVPARAAQVGEVGSEACPRVIAMEGFEYGMAVVPD